jgi:hypothetical protein
MMSVVEIFENAQYVVDKQGKRTAVLLNLENWAALRHLLEELAEDERLGQLLAEVESDESLEGTVAREVYATYRAEADA